MGLFSSIFGSQSEKSRSYDNDRRGRSSGEPSIKTGQGRWDGAKNYGDKYTHTGGGKHEHSGYVNDTAGGGYKEFWSGSDRSDR